MLGEKVVCAAVSPHLYILAMKSQFWCRSVRVLNRPSIGYLSSVSAFMLLGYE